MIEGLRKHLFPDDDAFTYAVIDGAACPELLSHLDESQPEYCCLYAGQLEPDMELVAPYLVELQVDHPFTEWLLSAGFGQHWTIFARARAKLSSLRKHFRTFLMVKSPEGESLYFRYYDPRVFRVYLPTCTAEEIQIVCGPVKTYLMEGEAPGTLLRFASSRAKLETLNLTNSADSEAAEHLPPEAHAEESQGDTLDVPPLRITNAQVMTFSAGERESFVRRMIAHLQKFFPRPEVMKEKEIRLLIEEGVRRAEGYGIRMERDVCLFIDAMIMLGAKFDEDPRFSWAKTLLRGAGRPEDKMTSLYHAAMAHAEERQGA